MIINNVKVFYSKNEADMIASMLQSNDSDWQYSAVSMDNSDYSYIEVVDCEGYFLGYI